MSEIERVDTRQALASLGLAHGLMELLGAFHTGEQTLYLRKTISPTVERAKSAKTTAADYLVMSTTSIKKESVRNTVDKVQEEGNEGLWKSSEN